MAPRSSLFQSNQNNSSSPNQFGSRPNMKNYQVSPIKNLLSTAKSAVIVSPDLSVDSISAALALALTLQKNNLNVSVYCPQKTDQNYSKLSGLQFLTDTYSDNDLTVTLDYPLDNIDQVSYNDNNQRLNLVVKTKPNSPQVDTTKISINNQSSGADVCFMLGDETKLGQNSHIVNRGNWVFISPVAANKPWAKASLIDKDAPFCEIFSFLLPLLGYKLGPDSAKNLLIGLRVSTQSFSINVSPESFSAAALCLRATQVGLPPLSPASATPTPTVGTPPEPTASIGATPTPIGLVESAPATKFQPGQAFPLPTT